MTLIELKQIIDDLISQGHGGEEVIRSQDDEGNGFDSVSEAAIEMCYEGEPVHPDDLPDYDEDDLTAKFIVW